ncbi:hypothetical protein [Streptomyces lancefieldiae]|uniref:Uncharacterized protein n=1 Tax=Streptomyces lancefieldiae TaxID=3075520 RepID=A0ABU3AYG5_9ACTN|nr:hypothetical protein [Streptomyces sp. DSM 40712]MDT0615044.1 hypothetical protein [Streptomyces sp. DSM 40712]
MNSHLALVAAAAAMVPGPPEAEAARSAADGSGFPLGLLADEE